MITISLSHAALQSAVFKAFTAGLYHERGIVQPMIFDATLGWYLVEGPVPGFSNGPTSEYWNSIDQSNKFWFDRSLIQSANPHDYILPLKVLWEEAKKKLDLQRVF